MCPILICQNFDSAKFGYCINPESLVKLGELMENLQIMAVFFASNRRKKNVFSLELFDIRLFEDNRERFCVFSSYRSRLNSRSRETHF